MAYVHENRAHITNSQNGKKKFVLFSLSFSFIFLVSCILRTVCDLAISFSFSTHRSSRFDSICKFCIFCNSFSLYALFYALVILIIWCSVVFSYSRLMSIFFYLLHWVIFCVREQNFLFLKQQFNIRAVSFFYCYRFAFLFIVLIVVSLDFFLF